MTSPDKIEHRIRLTPESSAAAKQAAHDGYVSFNAWAQEAFDEKLARLTERFEEYRATLESQRQWSKDTEFVAWLRQRADEIDRLHRKL